MTNKIDKKLLNLVQTLAGKEQKVDCLVYANNYNFAKRYLTNFCGEVFEYPFIKAFGVKTNCEKIVHLSKMTQISYISSVAKVFAQMNVSKKVMHIDSVQNKYDGEGVTVAVIDTGIAEHFDFCSFKNRILVFKDFVNGIEIPYDDNGHGTFVSGVIAGNGFLSGKKFSGVAPNSNLIMLKALDHNGETGSLTILNAMQWIYENKQKYNIKVVCMSFGSEPLDDADPLLQGAEALWNSGIVVVAAAGNSGPEQRTIKSPGASGKIITVGALDDAREGDVFDEKKFKIANFSSRGPAYNFFKPDCIACGVDIVSTSNVPSEFYSKMSGTSVSTPIVAGSCALLLESNPNLSPFEVKRKIMSSCKRFKFDRNTEGYGILDVEKLCS